MKRILVTGGSGFVGGYVYRYLCNSGYEVKNFDIVGDETDRSYIKGSILDLDEVKRAVDKANIIFHFAGFTNIDHVKANPKDCIELNIMGTTNFLEAVRQKGKGEFIFASSVYVHNTRGHLYTASKLAAELICENYSRLYGIPTIIMRLATVYGEESRHEDVVSIFVRQACAGQPITIHGSGEQIRHFIHGEDVARACRRVIEKDIAGTTLILAYRYGVSVNKLAETIIGHFPSCIIERREDMAREDDYQGDVDDASNTYKVLEWEPKIDLEEGVKRLISYFKEK